MGGITDGGTATTGPCPIDASTDDDAMGTTMDCEGGKKETFMTLASALDALGWGPFHWRLTLQCGLSWACDMIEISLISFLVPNTIGTVFLVDAPQAQQDLYGFLLGAVTFAGILLGSLCFGLASDVYGRRLGYLVSTAIIALFGLLCAASPNLPTLIALRAVVGFGLGGVTCSFTLLSEVVGQRSRGKKVILSMGLLWTAGGLFSAAAAWISFTVVRPLEWQWRALVMISAAPSVLILGLFPWLIESPRYHLNLNREQEALATLTKIDSANNNNVKGRKRLPANLRLIHHSGKGGSSGGKGGNGKKVLGVWRTLVSKEYLLTTTLVMALWFLNMGAYFGICFVTPSYFKAMNGNEFLASLIEAAAEIPGLVAASFLVDWCGRKRTLMGMYACMAVATAVMSLDEYLPFPALVVAAVFSRGSADGGIMTLYLYTPEVYKTHVRNVALGLGSAVSRVAAILASYLSFRSGAGASGRTAIIVYAVFGLVSGGCAFFLPHETKDWAVDGDLDDDEEEGEEQQQHQEEKGEGKEDK